MGLRRLPSFAALRAFEALGRTLSFTAAGEDLGITQAAVSRQVKHLERELGVRLVERDAKENRLTAQGRTLFVALGVGFDHIEAAVREIASPRQATLVTLSVAPYFSARWLTPHIMQFVQAHPAIDLRLHHAYEPPDYRREQVDLGINWGTGHWPGVIAERFLNGDLTPVCSPGFIQQTGSLERPEEILNRQLFYEFDLDDWRAWFTAAGIEAPRSLRATRLDDSSALRRAALDGLGIALFFRSLIEEDLETGRLVQPLPLSVDVGRQYFLNYPEERPLSATARKLRRWLLRTRDDALCA